MQPEHNSETNRILEDFQALLAFLQKYEGTAFVTSELKLLSRLHKEHGENYIRRWYEMERCFMLDDIAPEDIQAIAIRAYLDQVDWEAVTTYAVTQLNQVNEVQVQEAA